MDPEATYQETLNYLYSFVDYSLTRSFRYSADKFDLGRMVDFLQALGRPHEQYPIIHVAGTKGKGSVSVLCASALQAGGYRVGLYTSPHLSDYAERIQVNGQPIAHADLVELVEEIKPRLPNWPQLTTFEITTALAFLHFARQGVNAAVIEVGLGGRLDATNVVKPAVAVITSISYDHTQILGDTLTAIAQEKGGIIKPGIPVVLAPQKEEARLEIERVAQARGAPLLQVGREWRFAAEPGAQAAGQGLRVWPGERQAEMDAFLAGRETGDWQPARLQISLLGRHQVENAATAYAALQAAGQRGLPLTLADIQTGFSKAQWPGRFEILRPEPPVVIDAAHNRDSALRLRQALDDYFPGRPVVLIFGASEDKDIEGILLELRPRLAHLIATRSFHPRAAEPQALVELARKDGIPASLVGDVPAALEAALSLAAEMAKDGALVLATGSIFIAAAVRDCWFGSNQ